jgi:AraC-like DNA-binding protein
VIQWALMTPDILTLSFQPQRHPDFGVEVSTIADLRRRAVRLLGRPQRLLFFSLLAFTGGEAEQMVDFRVVPCRAGDVLFIAPEQVFQLNLPVDCDGYVIIYRPDFLPPDNVVLSPLYGPDRAIHLYRCGDSEEQRELLADCEALMRTYLRHNQDALSVRIAGYQLQIILTRLARLSASSPAIPDAGPYTALMRRFRELVERQYRHSRSLAAYAAQLYCSARTLQRAVASHTGQSGKAYIDGRVMLEAKRLLAYSDDSVATIGAFLGFSEATNFGKYFQRHEGMSPDRFRSSYR